MTSEPATYSTADISAALTRLGAGRRAMATCIPHPGTDPRLSQAAEKLVTDLYVDGDFGDADRDGAWLKAKMEDLAGCLQGAFEDWCVEATVSREQGSFEWGAP